MCSLTDSDIINHYTLTVRKKFDAPQETSERPTLNDEYKNFVIPHISRMHFNQTKIQIESSIAIKLDEKTSLLKKLNNFKRPET